MTGACSNIPSPSQTTTGPSLGFDPGELSSEIRPQDDFYRYVNGNWLDNTEIPPEWSRYGVAHMVFEQNEIRIRALIEEAANASGDAAGDQQKIGDLYKSFMNEGLVNERGISPLNEEIAKIDAIDSYESLVQYAGYALAVGIQSPVNFYIDADAKDPTRNLAYIWQDGLGLPNRDYYLDDNEKLAKIREEYLLHIENMFDLAGWSDGAKAAEDIVALEHSIAERHWTQVQNRDRETIYSNKFDIPAANELSPGFDWQSFLDAGGFEVSDQFIIAQTDYFAGLGDILHKVPLEQWRTYFRFKALKSYARYLNDAIVKEDFNFQGRILTGQQAMRPRWKNAVRLVNGAAGELVGKEYVRKYFPEQSKKRMDEMVSWLRKAFGQAIDGLEWMSSETKQAARNKLSKFSYKIGYPDDWIDYSALTVRVDELFGNVRRSRQFEHSREVEKLTVPVDRSEWGMTPQTVNAYYRPTFNEIVFPAGILQPPFFNAEADDAVNYGAIGGVIGHEFSHGFDDQGRKFDGDGRLNNWWTKEDSREYEARAAGLIKQYAAFRPLDDMAINGELTLGENIGDLAGLEMAYRAYHLSLQGKEPPVIDGFTGDQRFFIGYAQGWRGKYRDASLREILLTDSHSPSEYRVTGVLLNLDTFYEAFNVKEGDSMYIPPEQRTEIW